MRKSLKIVLSGAVVYIVLILALVGAENGQSNGTIHTVWDAIWFSVETVTTVGYGDLSPISPAGKLISTFFALCSIGLLSALVGIFISLLGGGLLPRLRLRLNRRKEWFWFSEENEYSTALGEELSQKGIVIYFSDAKTAYTRSVFRLALSAENVQRLKGENGGLSLFFVGKDDRSNIAAATACIARGHRYCLCEKELEQGAENAEVSSFSRTDCMARNYWSCSPLKNDENRIVLIGCGKSGRALLERALLINVFQPGRTMTYHVFGDASEFQMDHYMLMQTLAADPAEDKICFHPESWKSSPELLQQADRIILCMEDDKENYRAYCTIKEYFITSAKIDVRLENPVKGIESFGSVRDVMTEENVIRGKWKRLAVEMNDIYNNISAANPVKWENLPPFLRASNIAAADHVPTKIRYLLDDNIVDITQKECSEAYAEYCRIYPEKKALLEEMEHRRWVRFHLMYNWSYALQRNNAQRYHPLLVPFEELSEEEKRKDDFAWEILEKLAK